MANHILIHGAGLLADMVQEHLTRQFVVRRLNFLTEVTKTTGLALVLHDAWQPSVHEEAEKVFRDFKIPWIRGFVSFGEGIIGPFIRPEKPGCYLCGDIRLMLAGPDRQERWRLRTKFIKEGGIQKDGWASKTGLIQMAYLIVREVERILMGEQSCIENSMFFVNLQTLSTSNHFFLSDPHCPFCSTLPEDTEELAELKINSARKLNADNYRCRSINEYKTVLEKDYLDYRTGILNGKILDINLPFADVAVNMPMFNGDEGTAGRSCNYETSEITAILEGLERYSGIKPRGKKRTVRDSYQNLKNIALNPERVGLHDNEHYDEADFPFKRFAPDVPMNWVWGYSFLQKRSILVPESLAYYSLGHEEAFVYETSNGCALGGSLEEAIFHGILEVVERDSFLLTWYAKLPLSRLDINSANDKELLLMIERLRMISGYELYFFNSTMEHGIPSVWGLAKNRNAIGLNLICAAGASLNPIHAVKSAIFEIAGMLYHHDQKLEEHREKCYRMLSNPFEVKTMEDHGLLYGLPEAEERLQFLLDDNRPARTFADEFEPRVKRLDLKDDLEDLLGRFNRLNLEVIVVDQTSPITKRNGLHCVKILIPGMLPMTFGHQLIRIKGLERILKVPIKLGFSEQALTYEQLNPHPHPFP